MNSVSKILRESGLPKGPSVSSLPPRGSRPMLGRQPLVDAVVRTLKSKRGSRHLIHGPRGVGKSTVTLEVANQLAQLRQYDYIIWLSFQSVRLKNGHLVSSVTALTSFSDLLRQLAMTVGDDSAHRGTEAERARAIALTLSTKKVLLIADNLDDLIDARTSEFLLELPDSVDVIGTATSDLSWPTSTKVERLADWAIRQIVSQELQSEPQIGSGDEVIEILRLTAGIPLTGMFLCQLVKNGSSLDSILGDMRKGGLDIHEYYIGRRFEDIRQSLPTLQLLTVAAMFPGYVTEQTCFNLLQQVQTVDDLRRSVRTLVGMNLIENAENSLTVLPVVREFMLANVSTDKSLADSLLTSWTEFVERRVVENIDTPYVASFDRLLEIKREVLLLIQWTRRLEPPNVIDPNLILFEQIGYFLYAQGYWGELLTHADWAMPLAGQKKRTSVILECGLTWCIKATIETQGPDAANQLFENYVALLPTDRTMSDNACVEVARAMVSRVLGHNAQVLAGQMVTNASLLRDLENHEWACRAMLRAGNLFSQEHAYVRAGRAFTWILDYDGVPHQSGGWQSEIRALALGNSGIMANKERKYKIAVDFLQQSFPHLAQRYDQATTHFELAFAFSELGLIDQSKLHLQAGQRLRIMLGVTQTCMESQPGWDLEQVDISRIDHESGKMFVRALRFVTRKLTQ